MATKRNPEERSTTGPATPGENAAFPTGEEVSKPAAEPRPAATRQRRDTQAAAEQPDLDDLQAMAADYYRRLTGTADQITRQARTVYDTGRGYVRSYPLGTFAGAFVVGVVIGVLMGRD
jgi:hypothetical protein